MNKLKTNQITLVGILASLSIILGLTPLGFIPIGLVKVTTMHIPTIIGGVLAGPVVGGFVGCIFGLFSLFQNITAPTPLSFMFYNPLVSVLPRIMIGVVSGLVFNGFKKINFSQPVSLFITGALGTITNTVGVLGMAYIFFHEKITQVLKIDAKIALGGIALSNGPVEALVSSLLVTTICIALLKNKKSK